MGLHAVSWTLWKHLSGREIYGRKHQGTENQSAHYFSLSPLPAKNRLYLFVKPTHLGYNSPIDFTNLFFIELLLDIEVF